MAETLLQNYLSPRAYRSLQVEKLKRNIVVSDEWKQYISDPIAFVYDFFEFPEHEKPALYQEEILQKLTEYKRVSVRGPRGLGKTALSSWAIIWFACTRPQDTKIPCTASAWRQLEVFLWPEIRKWHERADWRKWRMMGGKIPTMFMLKMRVGDECLAFALASDKAESMEGAHGTNLLYVFDEAKAIPPEMWDSAEGAFSTGDGYWLAVSTPGNRGGRFFEIHRKAKGYERWWARHVKLEEAIDAGRVLPSWAEEMKNKWGEDHPIYQSDVLGEFPVHEEDSLINVEWIYRARENELQAEGTPKVGIDIARFGSDSSAMIGIQGGVVLGAEIWSGNDLMTSTGKIAERIKNGFVANVDVIGVGSGVVDRLKEQGLAVNGINVASKPINGETFLNLRAELYWNLRDRFKNEEIDLTRLDQETFDRLLRELSAIKYNFRSSGQIFIESKDDMIKRIGHSPDVADALCLAFCPNLHKEPEFEIQQLTVQM